MPDRSNSPNHFLASLSPGDYALIQPHLRPVELHQGLVLYVAQDAIERVYFPHNGVISMIVAIETGIPAEVARRTEPPRLVGWNQISVD